MEDAKFIPGLKLGELFHNELIQPILASDFTHLQYSNALIGEGSEILGYDTPQSTDHCWGPRAMLFLSESDYQTSSKEILAVLHAKLPPTFMGYTTRLDCPVKNTIDIYTVKSFFKKHLSIDPTKELQSCDWLTFPSQKLLEVTSGQVYRDDVGLDAIRKKFTYYPHDIWLYLLSCQWTKIAQEEAFIGRTGDTGDELGSQIVAARLVRELMKLCFLMEKQYAPYTKWFGTAFTGLQSAKEMSPMLRSVLLSQSWKEREEWLSKAYTLVAELHNSLKLTKPMATQVSNYFDRPYLVIHADAFAEAIRKEITDPAVKAIKTNIGAVDQFVDSTDVLSYPEVFKKLKLWANT